MNEARALLVAVALTVGGCGSSGGGSSFDIPTTTLSGKVGGQPWTLVSGETDAFLSMGKAQFFTTMYMESVTPCTGAGFSVTTNQLIMNIPMTPGDYNLSLDLSQTFVVDPGGSDQNDIAISGRIVVDQVTATMVSGGANIQFDADNSVSGQFQATVCAQ
jgi:hypothetical protein